MPLVIFDIDGTLTHTTGVDDACFHAAIEHALQVRGFDPDWANYPHATDSGLLHEIARRHLHREPTADEARTAHERFVSLLHAQASVPGRIQPVPGAHALLRGLRADPSWSLAIATGAWHASAQIKLRTAALGVDDLPLATASDAHSRADITLHAIARAMNTKHEPADPDSGPALLAGARRRFAGLVYVGDGLWDLRTSRGLGLGFVGVRVEGDTDALRREGAEHILRDYLDTPAVIALLRSQAEAHA